MKKILGQALTVLSGRTLIRAVQFLSLIILVRSLSPSEFGWFGILTSAFALVGALGSLGLRQSFAYEIARGKISVGEVLGLTLCVLPILALPSAAILSLLYANRLPGFSVILGIGVIAVGVLSSLSLNLLQGVFLGTGRIRSFTFSEAAPHLLVSVSVLLLFIFSAVTFEATVWIQSVAGVVAFPVLFLLAFSRQSRLRFQVGRFFNMLRYGIVFAFNLFAIMLSYRISMFVIEYFDGSGAAGQYFAAIRVCEIFLEIASALGMVLFSNSARNGLNQKATIVETAHLAATLFWLFVLASVALALFAPFLLRVVVGSQYSEAVLLLQVLAISMPATAACKVIYPSLAGMGRASFGSALVVAGLIVNCIGAVVLVPIVGPVGGCVGLIVGQYLLLAMYIAKCRKVYKTSVRDFLWPFSIVK
ncbi:oligosaccharide flippase family protein [Rhodococcoides fascians]|uniref:oligosaccharide flippase family protein n=1 Tax=Rhodococcoides fascians TaxID=1828 RepID=UPI000A649897|nr:oligosaccharide flippase family protein [Rhodococcus fascians]